MTGRRLLALPAAAALLLLGGCTVLDQPTLPRTGARTPASTTSASISITPVTPDGLITGPGVTDSEITLAVLADPSRDRGFTGGVRLWQQSVNTSGGVCGRTIDLLVNGTGDVPADPASAYRSVGRDALGLLTLLGEADNASALSIAADQIPAVTPTGTSTRLGSSGPLVAGATADILTINGLSNLLRSGAIRAASSVLVLSDGSATARDGLRGARWWADRNGMTLDVREAANGLPAVDASSDRPVLALVDASTVRSLVAGTSSQVPVLTLLDGFDPDDWGAGDLRAAAGRVFVATPAPAYGSDFPAVVALASHAAAAGQSDPGARTVDGYATAAAWGRLLAQACLDRDLTRDGIRRSMTEVGSAPADSLFGAADPGRVVLSGRPATLVSSMSVADATVPTGLRSLVGLESAPGIDDYAP